MQDILSENIRLYRFVNTITDALSGTDLCFVFRAYSETGPVQYTTRRKKSPIQAILRQTLFSRVK